MFLIIFFDTANMLRPGSLEATDRSAVRAVTTLFNQRGIEYVVTYNGEIYTHSEFETNTLAAVKEWIRQGEAA
jgi:asparagine synthetase B (glutamine-hydrolysing)